MLAALAFLFFGWPLLVAIGIFFIVISILFEEDWWFINLFFVAVSATLLYFAGHISIPNWTEIVLYVACYFGLGIMWSFYKWIIFVHDLKKEIEAFIACNPRHGFGVGVNYVMKNWADMKREERFETIWSECLCDTKFYKFLNSNEVKAGKLAPTLSTWQNKGRIVSWIAYWPLSVVNYVFERLIRDIINWVIDSLKGIYNSIAEYILKGLRI